MRATGRQLRSVSKTFWVRTIPTSRKKLDSYRKVNVCGGKHVGICWNTSSLSPTRVPKFIQGFTALLSLPITTATVERSFRALRRLKTYPQAWCVNQCGRHRWRFCSIRKQEEGTSFSAIRIDCNKYRLRKALFYCGTEINILKFRYTLHIQLIMHTINSLEGLICLLYYRVTLGMGLEKVKKLATPLEAARFFSPFSRSLSVIFGGYTSNHFNDQLSLGLLVQLVKALHPNMAWPGIPEFFFINMSWLGGKRPARPFSLLELLRRRRLVGNTSK